VEVSLVLQDDSNSWAERLAQASARHYGNEAALRHGLYTVLYPYVTEVIKMNDNDIKHETKARTGRIDSLFGRVLIEYKAPGELDSLTKRRKHAGQALRYLRDEGIGADVVILTDGDIWGVLRDTEGPEIGEQGWLEFDTPIAAHDDELFQWRGNSVQTARRILDLLDTIRTVPVTTQSLADHLGVQRAEMRQLIEAFRAALTSRKSGSRTDILFEQWIRLAGVSYGIKSTEAYSRHSVEVQPDNG